MTLPEIFNYLWTEAEVIWFIGIVIAFFVIKQILNLLFPKKSKQNWIIFTFKLTTEFVVFLDAVQIT